MKNKTVQEEPSCGLRHFLWVFVSRCKGLEARSQMQPRPCSMAGYTMANTVRQSCEALAGNKACFVLVRPSISYKSNWPCVKCVRAATLPSDTDWLWLTISNMACSRPGYIIWQLAWQRSKWKSDKNQRRQQTHFQSLETQLSSGVVLFNIKFVYSQDVWHVLKSSSRPWGTNMFIRPIYFVLLTITRSRAYWSIIDRLQWSVSCYQTIFNEGAARIQCWFSRLLWGV